jgi:hypothetical protein
MPFVMSFESFKSKKHFQGPKNGAANLKRICALRCFVSMFQIKKHRQEPKNGATNLKRFHAVP